MKTSGGEGLRRGVIIVAGGAGRRMGSGIPKQYREIAGKAVILHTMERFLAFDPAISIVVVLSSGHRNYWDQTVGSAIGGIAIAPGGRNRYDSVKNGLLRMDTGVDLIGIHDAVRPLVSPGTLKRSYASAADWGSGIPVIEMDETVRMLKADGHSQHLDRSLLRRVQTPQVFRAELIRKAYQESYQPDFTDDASVYESQYGEVSLVKGNAENIKITTPADLMLAGLLIDQRSF